MDTTFIIDSSVCDNSGNWNRLLYFVQTLVNFFNVSPSGGRIALVTFNSDAKVVLKFNTLSGSLLNHTLWRLKDANEKQAQSITKLKNLVLYNVS